MYHKAAVLCAMSILPRYAEYPRPVSALRRLENRRGCPRRWLGVVYVDVNPGMEKDEPGRISWDTSDTACSDSATGTPSSGAYIAASTSICTVWHAVSSAPGILSSLGKQRHLPFVNGRVPRCDLLVTLGGRSASILRSVPRRTRKRTLALQRCLGLRRRRCACNWRPTGCMHLPKQRGAWCLRRTTPLTAAATPYFVYHQVEVYGANRAARASSSSTAWVQSSFVSSSWPAATATSFARPMHRCRSTSVNACRGPVCRRWTK